MRVPADTPKTAANSPPSPQNGSGGVLVGVKPARGLAYIRKVATQETYAGGRIVVPDPVRDKVSAMQFEVVSLGNYEKCSDLDVCPFLTHSKRGEHKHRLQVGDWVLCRNRSWAPTPDPDVYVIKQAHILGVFRESD
jgi:hypothetical protein